MTTKDAVQKNKPKLLPRAQFGNPVLRSPAKQLANNEITSPKIQKLIKDMQATLLSVKLGIGLAAPQVGEGIALAVIAIHPTTHRPKVKPFDLVIINPKITKTFGRKKQLWEGCISSGKGKAGLFAKVPRYEKITLGYTDEKGKRHHEQFKGLKAHVIQHETDHLGGILFVDKVKDTKTYMTYNEYMKKVKAASVKKEKA